MVGEESSKSQTKTDRGGGGRRRGVVRLSVLAPVGCLGCFFLAKLAAESNQDSRRGTEDLFS